MILEGIMRHAKEANAQVAVVFVDFAKAFDTQEHILCALEQRRLDKHVIELIKNSYVDCVTRVGSAGTSTQPINIKVGVKQGDPMSPLLFNLAMDPLIQALEETGEGYQWDGRCVATLAFADDLVLLSGSDKGMTVLESFCEVTGLRVQPKKCNGFMIKKGTVLTDRSWKVNGEILHQVQPGESVKYLGVEIEPCRGIVIQDLIPKLHDWVMRITKAPLKPSQKVKVLNSFALPRLIY